MAVLVDRNTKSAVGSMQLAVGNHVSDRLAGEDHQGIDGVVVDGVNIAVGGIDVEAALELDLCVQSADDPLGVCDRRGTGLGLAVVHQNVEQVFVRYHHLVVRGVYRYRAVSRVGVADHSHGLSIGQPGRIGGRGGIPGDPLLQ